MSLTSLTDRAGALHWSLRRKARALDTAAERFRQLAADRADLRPEAQAFVPIIAELANIASGLARVAERIALGEGE